MPTVKESIIKHFFNSSTNSLKWGAVGNVALNGMFAVSQYDADRDDGHGVIYSAAGAAGDIVMGSVLGAVPYMALTMAPELGKIGMDAFEGINQYGRNLQRQSRNTPFQNATFLDSQQTYTMRQAGMNLARQSRMASQQAMLGNEAQAVSYMGR